MPRIDKTIDSILVEAVEIASAADRATFVAKACGGDSVLQKHVEEMIANHFEAGDFLQVPAAVDEATYITNTPDANVGSMIGPYKLREVLGEGGMGTVFVAAQEKPVRRKVALKLIKLGMDSKEVLSRFEAERQALALMDHPNIAHVFDAGMTDAGRPYFVMELVKGLPITEHCDLQKLGSRERLELFVQVCRAIQHAHQKGIIHRDLKPSNVLVAMHDTIPVVKVIDFGVAKAIGQSLTEKSLYTGLGQMVGTPMYMSPEQAGQSSIDVDTRSDVYSLGVLLYELLTGCTPFEKDTLKQVGFDELRRMIQEVDPPRPSTRFSTLNAAASSTIANCRQSEPHKLSQQLRGELDWIVMKALEKDRSRRYESASTFAADIHRFLHDEAVEASPPSVVYRATKFLKRNRGSMAAAGVLLLTLVAGLIGTSVGLLRAVDAEKKAEARSDESEKARIRAEQAEALSLADFRASTDDAIEQLIASREQLGPEEKAYLKNTLARWQDFATRQPEDQRGTSIRAEGYFRVAELLTKLGQSNEARSEYEAAIELQTQVAAQASSNPDYQIDLLKSRLSLSDLLLQEDLLREAQQQLEAAKATGVELVANLPNDLEAQFQLSRVYGQTGLLLSKKSLFTDAIAEFELARNLRHQLVINCPNEPKFREYLASVLSHIALNLTKLGKSKEARLVAQSSIDLQKQLVCDFPDQPKYAGSLVIGYQTLVNILLETRSNFDQADSVLKEALAVAKDLASKYPAAPRYRSKLADVSVQQSHLSALMGLKDETVLYLQTAIDEYKYLSATYPDIPRYFLNLESAYNRLGALYSESGRMEDAIDQFRLSDVIISKLVEEYPLNPDYQGERAANHSHLGNLYTRTKQFDEAKTEFKIAIEIRGKIVASFPEVPENVRRLANAHIYLASLLNKQGEIAEAQIEYEKAIEYMEPLVKTFPSNNSYRITLGDACAKLGASLFENAKLAECRPWLHRSEQALRLLYDENPKDDFVRSTLNKSYLRLSIANDCLRNLPQAEKDWEQGRELCSEQELASWRGERIKKRLQFGLVDEAMAEAAELVKSQILNDIQVCNLACIYSIASTKFPSSEKAFADQAMELLERAVKAGYRDRAHLSRDADLIPLHDREDYRALLERMSEEQSKTPTK